MTESIHLSDLWEHTITIIFKHDPESELPRYHVQTMDNFQ